MKSAVAALVSAALLSTGIRALQLNERSANPAVISLDTQRKDVIPSIRREGLRRRDQTVSVTLDNEQTLYYINITIGSPPQNFKLHIDTGSSDVWTNYAKSKVCESDNSCVSGTYNPNASSTYHYVNSLFDISYVDGSGASGDYVTDNMKLGDATVKNLEFGVGYKSTKVDGVLGIGYPSNEAILEQPGTSSYKNLPQLLVQQNYIQSTAFSLWLNDLQASTGQILFGGVNTDKYHGSLTTLATQGSAGKTGTTEFNVALTGVGFSVDGENSTITSGSLPGAVLLDSGSSLSYLPDDIASAITSEVQAVYSQSEGVYLVDCSLAGNSSYVTFTFSDLRIAVPFSELVVEANNSNECIFGIVNAGNSPNILGDTFLRSAYVVYDLDNNQISIAQTNFNSTQDAIVEIGTGTTAVPDATGVANPATADSTATGGGRLGLPSGSATTTGGGSGPSTTHSKGGAYQTQIPLGAVAMAGMGALWAL